MHSPSLNHTVLPVGDAIVHVYFLSELAEKLATPLVEGKQSLTGAYRYDLHSPHTPKGQYHIHVYLKNNQIFAINWDGTAHDQSHRKVIPGKVFAALKAEFPDLVMPPNRIIECIFPGSAILGGQTPSRFDSSEMLRLKHLITEEVKGAGGTESFPFSRFSIYQGDHVPFMGWPFLVVGAEFRENGDAVCEGHLVWIRGQASDLRPESCRFTMKPMEFDDFPVSRLELVFSSVLQCAEAKVQAHIDQQWSKDRGTWAYPKFEFHERPFEELLRLWLFGAATKEIRAIHANTGVSNLKENLGLIVKLTPFEPSAVESIE